MESFDKLRDSKGYLSQEGILNIMPYGKGCLMLDEIRELTKKKIIASKRFTGNEDFLKEHFIAFPIVPGTVVIEAIGQAGSVLARYRMKEHEKEYVVLHGIKDAKFFFPIIPNQEIVLEVVWRCEVNKKIMMEGKAMVNGRIVVSAMLILAVVERKEFESRSKS